MGQARRRGRRCAPPGNLSCRVGHRRDRAPRVGEVGVEVTNRLPLPPPVPAEAREVALTLPPPSRVARLDVAEVAHHDEYASGGARYHRAFANDCRGEVAELRAIRRDDSWIRAWVRLEHDAGVDTYPDTSDLRATMLLRGVLFMYDFDAHAWTCEAGDPVEVLRQRYPQRSPWAGEFVG